MVGLSPGNREHLVKRESGPSPRVIDLIGSHAGIGEPKKTARTLGWLSDIHLDFLKEDEIESFIREIASVPVDGWLISGDIGTADNLERHLDRLHRGLGRPIYFTLGNHDFYGGSLTEVRGRVEAMTRTTETLIWLTTSEPRYLGETAIVGDDAWGDGRFGDPEGTPVELTDFVVIRELAGLSRRDLLVVLRRLGDEAADRLAPRLEEAALRSRQVIVVTHVPPFEDAAWYEGRRSSDDFLPWFACRAVGEAILASAGAHPETRFLVLCGHTHGAGTCTPAPNVTVLTAGAEYGRPDIQAVIRFT